MSDLRVDLTPRGLPPTCADFVRCDDPFSVIVGPVGSGKSTACVKQIGRRAARQKRGPDGLRRSRWGVVRNTYGQLRDTTRKTFEQWLPAQLGTWHEQSFTFNMAFDDVRAEILFRALDRPEDVRKLLSLEVTGWYFNELREIPKHVVDVAETRAGRFPAQRDGGPSWFGIWGDSNPWHPGHWLAKTFAKNLPGHRLFRQPGGRAPNAENVQNLPPGYYDRLAIGKDKEYVRVYIDGEDASGDVGAVFGAWVAALESAGRLCAFDHPTSDLFTVWDLGHSDSTGIWIARINAERQVDVVDHYESAGQGLSHYFDILDGKRTLSGEPWRYAFHWLPHDARAKTLATQQTVAEQLAAHYGVGKVGIVPDIGLDDGIGAARWLLEQGIRIHSRCDVPGRMEYSGVDALRGYRFEWDEKDQVFSRTPVHNWASHTADAFRYLAVVVKHVERLTRPQPAPAQVSPFVPAHKSFTLDQLLADRARVRR